MKATSKQLIQIFHDVTDGITFRPTITIDEEPPGIPTTAEGTFSYKGTRIDARLEDFDGIQYIELGIKLPQAIPMTAGVLSGYRLGCGHSLGLVAGVGKRHTLVSSLKSTMPLLPGVNLFFHCVCDQMVDTANDMVAEVAR